MNPRVMLALAVSAGMALIVAGIFYQIAGRGQANPSEEVALREVVVAAKETQYRRDHRGCRSARRDVAHNY